jgi:dUTP pyrophosphatase
LSEKIKLKVQTMSHYEGLPLPTYATDFSAGMDLLAAIEEEILLKPMARVLVPTGIALAIPRGYEVQVRPRSGLAIKNGIGLVNSPGTIDADYRGEIKVILINLGQEDFLIKRGMRIAQMVLAPVMQMVLEPTVELEKSERGTGGFGHTGI